MPSVAATVSANLSRARAVECFVLVDPHTVLQPSSLDGQISGQLSMEVGDLSMPTAREDGSALISDTELMRAGHLCDVDMGSARCSRMKRWRGNERDRSIVHGVR